LFFIFLLNQNLKSGIGNCCENKYSLKIDEIWEFESQEISYKKNSNIIHDVSSKEKN